MENTIVTKNNLGAVAVAVFVVLGGTLAGSGKAFAEVYTCENHETAKGYLCNRFFYKSLPEELSKRSPRGERASVAEALSSSTDDGVKNGYNTISNTDLGIHKFWHKAKDYPLDRIADHITVRVYKRNKYVKTCHIWAQLTEKETGYITNCEGPR